MIETVERVVLNALGIIAALPCDVCAFGDTPVSVETAAHSRTHSEGRIQYEEFAGGMPATTVIVLGEADPPLLIVTMRWAEGAELDEVLVWAETAACRWE